VSVGGIRKQSASCRSRIKRFPGIDAHPNALRLGLSARRTETMRLIDESMAFNLNSMRGSI